MKSRIYYIIISVILISIGLKYFIELTDDYYENDLNGFDGITARYIESFRTEPLNSFMRVFTRFGDNTFYIILIIAVLVHFRKSPVFKHTLQILIVILISYAISYALKAIIDRPRPDGARLVNVITQSFPSGHAFSAATFYILIIYFFFKYNLRLKFILSVFCFLMVILMGISRIYLGVHYTSDVLAGYCAGMFLTGLTILIYEIFGYLNDKKKSDQYFI